MTHPTCKTCKHFKPNADEWSVPKRFGFCDMIAHCWEMEGFNPRTSDVEPKPFFVGHLAAVGDGSSYRATLYCDPDFYCAMHSDMKPDLNPFSEYDYKDHSNDLDSL